MTATAAASPSDTPGTASPVDAPFVDPATADAALADCLRTALDADAVAVAIGRLARNRSAWAAVLAKQSLSILDACVEACRPHRAAHPACRACFDACGKAIAATRAA